MNLRRFSNHTLGVSHHLLEVAVTARLQAVTEGVAVAVEDAGHGIEPEHLPHLLERFYRTEQRVRRLKRSWRV